MDVNAVDILYQTFVKVVDSETLSRAAEALHTTQPTVTRQIQQLERQLGVPLFERIGKRLIPTHAGRRVYEYAIELANVEGRMQDEIREYRDPEAGIIRMGAGLSPTLYRVPALLAAYAAKHPRVRFQVLTGSSRETIARLQRRDIDIAIVTTPPRDAEPSMTCIPLWQDQLSVVASPKHQLAGKTCTLFEFVEQPMVVMHRDSGLRRLLHETFVQAGVEHPIRPVIETDSLEAMSRFVQAGLGLAIIPWSAVREDVRVGRLATVALQNILLGSRTITSVVRQPDAITAAAQQFLHVLPDLVKLTHSDEFG
jgi:LysR family transcriptional regulator, low CO2-responsive transcriptional regulator